MKKNNQIRKKRKRKNSLHKILKKAKLKKMIKKFNTDKLSELINFYKTFTTKSSQFLKKNC